LAFLRYRREEAWATLVNFLGLPADPAGHPSNDTRQCFA
jgi:hypothetical protein